VVMPSIATTRRAGAILGAIGLTDNFGGGKVPCPSNALPFSGDTAARTVR